MYAQANHSLSERPGDEVLHHSLRYVPSIGIEAGGPVMWWGDVAHDQRPTDAFSLVYDSDPLDEPLEILGSPRALLKVSTDATRANWFVRLCDVAPDDTVTQVAGAGFNGTHRESAKQPRDLEPGGAFDLDIEMHFTSWVFPPGHRIRFSVNNSMWPMMWPTPFVMTTKLELGGEAGARLVLPTIPFEQRPVPNFLPPEKAAELARFESLDAGMASGYGEISSIDRNPQTGTVTVTATNTVGRRYPWGEERYRATIVHETSDAHPGQTSVRGEHSMVVELEGRSLAWEATLSFRSDEKNFYYSYMRRLTENGVLVREKTWNETLPRDYQ